MQYGFVRPVSIDDFEEVEALIVRGQTEGHLLPRTPEQIAQILPSCFGYRIGDEHLAGICSLLTEPYRRDRAGEITAMYTLTRFQGEGVAAVLVREILKEAARAASSTSSPAPATIASPASSPASASSASVPATSPRPSGAATIPRGSRASAYCAHISTDD